MKNIYLNIYNPNFSNLLKAKINIENNNIIGLPTETVYGLAGNAYSHKSVKKIFNLKKRTSINPLIIHFYNINDLKKDAILNRYFFKLYKAFASEGQIQDLEVRYQKGIGWGEAKDILYSELESKIEPIRERYELIRHDKRHLEHILIEGAVKAREVSSKIISDVREAVGIKGFC